MRRLLGGAMAALGLLLSTACAARPEPRFVRAADLGTGGPLQEGQALVIEFQEGDTIPLTLTIDGPFVETPRDLQPVALRVRRHFFLRIDGSDLRASADGKNFDEKPSRPGSFMFGFGASKAGPQVTIAIHTPTPAAAPPPHVTEAPAPR